MNSISKYAKEDADKVFKNRSNYNSSCLIHNWYDERAQFEERTRKACYKENRRSLLIQKIKNITDTLTKPTDLAKDLDSIRYGQNYILRASDAPNMLTKKYREGKIRGLMYLSALINGKDIQYTQSLDEGCGLSCSLDKSPTVRNTFTLISCGESDKCGQPVVYDQEIYIQIVNDGQVPLYVKCETSNFNSIGMPRSLYLSSQLDHQCRFKIVHWSLEHRYESSGTYVKPGTRILVQHISSGSYLTVEYSTLLETFFGLEAKVLCRSTKNVFNTDGTEYYWSFLGSEVPDKFYIYQAAQGYDVPISYLE